jgi:YVTN family beta-propeller protein
VARTTGRDQGLVYWVVAVGVLTGLAVAGGIVHAVVPVAGGPISHAAASPGAAIAPTVNSIRTGAGHPQSGVSPEGTPVGPVGSIVAILATGSDPVAVEVPAGNVGVWVANAFANNVTVFSSSTNAPIGSVSATDPIALASGNGLVWAADISSQEVTEISAASRTPYFTVPVGINPIGIAFDSANGYVYVANAASSNVTLLWGPSDRYTQSIYLGSGVGPEAIAYDASNGDVYTANFDNNNVSVISTSLNEVVASVPVGTYPVALGVDPSNGDVYVANSGSANVSVISGSQNKVIATIAVGVGPEGVAFGSGAGGYVFVSVAATDSISEISDATNKVVGSLPAGNTPTNLAYDSLNGDLYVVDYGSGEVSVVAAGFPVNFSESGLPVGANWSVVLGGASASSTGAAVGFNAIPGTYTYQILPPAGYTVTPRSGVVTLTGSFLVAVTFSAVAYPVSFAEDGLPGGTAWTVTVDGGPHSTTGTSFVLELPNGTYPYSVAGITGYTMKGGSGTITVEGSPGSVGVGFTPNSTTAPPTPATQVNVAGYDDGLAVAAALGAIGLGLGAASLLMVRRHRPPPPVAPGST